MPRIADPISLLRRGPIWPERPRATVRVRRARRPPALSCGLLLQADRRGDRGGILAKAMVRASRCAEPPAHRGTWREEDPAGHGRSPGRPGLGAARGRWSAEAAGLVDGAEDGVGLGPPGGAAAVEDAVDGLVVRG